MGRKRLIRTSVLPYHVTIRANNREWFYLPIEEVWRVFDFYLLKIKETYQIDLHAFVLMSNHLHMVLSTPKANLDLAMKYFLRESCRSINRTASRINHLFGGPYKWSLIGDSRHYRHVIKYVYRNPVKAGICQRVEEYRFSSLQANHLTCRLSPAIFENSLKGENEMGWLEWLNIPYQTEEDDCIRRALRRREFQFFPQRVTKKIPVSLDFSAK